MGHRLAGGDNKTMDTGRSFRRAEGTQIDLSDLSVRIFRHWKRLVICALAGAVLAGGYGYLAGSDRAGDPDHAVQADKDTSAADSVADGSAEDDSVAETEMKTEEERAQGVSDALALVQEIREMEEYMEQSVLMQTDPNHKKRTVLLYSIEDTDGHSLQKITESYLSFLTNGGAVEALKKADRTWKRMDTGYLAELITVSQKAGGSCQFYSDRSIENIPLEMCLYVEAVGADAGMTKKLAEDISGILEAYSRKVRDVCGMHELVRISSESGEKADAALLAQQKDKRSQLSAGRTNLKTLLDGFDEEQKIMYQTAYGKMFLTKEEDRADSGYVTQNPDPGAKKQTPETEQGDQKQNMNVVQEGRDQDAAQKDQSQTGDDDRTVSDSLSTANDPSGQNRGIHMLYVLSGLLAGSFFYILCYTAWYVLHDTVKSEREFRLYYKIPFYGILSTGGQDQAEAQDAGAKRAGLAYRIWFACKKRNLSAVFLAAEFSSGQETDSCVQELAGQLHGCGIDAVLLEKVPQNPSVWNMLTENGAVLLLCKMDRTTYRDVDDAMEFYLENKIEVLGAAGLR